MNKKDKTNLYFIGLLFLSVLFFSCDTEYIDKVNTIPGDVIKVPGYTQIETFTVKDSENNVVSAALTENTIVFTWSTSTPIPATVKPEIVLGTEAVISPASGTEIPFKDGAEYTVTSKAGTTKKYTLKIDFRQQEPKTWTYASSETYRKGTLQRLVNIATGGSNNAIDNLWLSVENTRVYFVAASDQKTEYTAEIAYLGGPSATLTAFSNYGIYYYLPEDMPLGNYDLRVKNGIYTLQNASVENRFKISVIEPDSFSVDLVGSPAQKQGGETLEVRGGMLNTITSVIMYNSTASTVTYPVEVVSSTAYRAVLKIPAGTPAGTYNRMRFYRGTASTLSSFTVTVK